MEDHVPEAIAGDPDEDVQARVLAWMERTGRGYKAASREFGVARSTIQRWKRGGPAGDGRSERVGEVDLRTRGRAPSDAREDDDLEADLAGPVDGEDWISFLYRKVAESERAFRVALEVRHTSSMVRLQDLTVRYREKLELALREQCAVERASGEMPDPADIARQVLELVPEIASLQPQLARKIAAELCRVAATAHDETTHMTSADRPG